jgi:2-dehydropantoate 2-reductase
LAARPGVGYLTVIASSGARAEPGVSRQGLGGDPAPKICVVGGGAIGSLFAAHLSRVAEVWILTRREQHAEALRATGLHVSGKAEFVSHLEATAVATDLPPCDFVILATKATDVEEAVGRLSGLVPGACVMTTQNGLGADEIVRRSGPWSVISAVTFMSGNRHSDTHVEYELDTSTWLGPSVAAPPAREQIAAIAELLVGGGLKVDVMEDMQPALWSKLIFNATVNVVAALTQLPHDQHFRDTERLSDLGHLVRQLVDEGKSVAHAAGVRLFEDPWEMNLQAIRRGETGQGAYSHLPSMLQDVLAARRTEVDFITGQLVAAGLQHDVDVTLHLALYRLIKGREASFGLDVLPSPATVDS